MQPKKAEPAVAPPPAAVQRSKSPAPATAPAQPPKDLARKQRASGRGQTRAQQEGGPAPADIVSQKWRCVGPPAIPDLRQMSLNPRLAQATFAVSPFDRNLLECGRRCRLGVYTVQRRRVGLCFSEPVPALNASAVRCAGGSAGSSRRTPYLPSSSASGSCALWQHT